MFCRAPFLLCSAGVGLLAAILSPDAAAENRFYLPGTGQVQKSLDFESPGSLAASFNYNQGWAGQGFGLSGTQRGAPEVVNVIANPSATPGSGGQVLAFNSQPRDSAWYAQHPEALNHGIYSQADGQNQDDFFMYGAGWQANEAPSTTLHVWLAEAAGYASLRMPLQYDRDGSTVNSWPGIWLHDNRITLRGPGRPDIQVQTPAPGQANGGSWWTLGLSITPDGDIQYYATPEYVTQLTPEHHIGSNSEVSAAAGQTYRPVSNINDAVIMSSNWSPDPADPSFFDGLLYTKNAVSKLTGDYNGDGFVSQGDLDLVLLNWGDPQAPLGFDSDALVGGGPFDGLVSQNELDGVLLNWGNGAPPLVSAIPEPGTICIVLSLLALNTRFR